jgi:hypothetical protein
MNCSSRINVQYIFIWLEGGYPWSSGLDVRPRIKGSSGLSPGRSQSLYLRMFTSSSKDEWCVDCLGFMQLKDPLGSFEKSMGSPWFRASNSGQNWNHWISMAPNHSDTHNARWANAEDEGNSVEPPNHESELLSHICIWLKIATIHTTRRVNLTTYCLSNWRGFCISRMAFLIPSINNHVRKVYPHTPGLVFLL